MHFDFSDRVEGEKMQLICLFLLLLFFLELERLLRQFQSIFESVLSVWKIE